MMGNFESGEMDGKASNSRSGALQGDWNIIQHKNNVFV